MGFTTVTFLFLFLPLTCICYFLFYKYMEKKSVCTAGNIVLALTSILFYAWAFTTNAVLLFLYVLAVYLAGCVIARSPKPVAIERRTKASVVPLILGVAAAILILYYYKYSANVADLFTMLFHTGGGKHATIAAPLGISFITFSAISYLVDVYRGDAPTGSFFDCLLYMFFFPKVVSGPIVPWKDFHPQIRFRRVTSGEFVAGINRIFIGFAKKVILADTFGLYASQIQYVKIDAPTAWFGWLLYALQIYYDFAGYSDIAIGVSKLFGFSIEENFHFPYRSTSITEFWRRWHISLGAFFRNYLYIPLGGNRKGKNRTLLNLAIVFVVTGVWHGVGLAYILWGAIHGFFVVAERMVKDKAWYRRIPKGLKWFGTTMIAASAWQFFRYGGNGKGAIAALLHLFGIHSYANAEVLYPVTYYLDAKIITLCLIGIVGATLLGSERLKAWYDRMKGMYGFYLLQELALIALMCLSMIFMMSSTYSPFIYFQF